MWLVLRRMPDRSRRSLTSPSRGLEEPILPILPILISEQHKNLQSHVLKMNCQHDLTLGRPWPDHYVGVNKRFLTDLFASMLAQAEGFTSSSEPPSYRGTTQHVEVRYPPSSLSFTWKARPVEAQDLKSGTSEWSFSVDLMLSKKHSRSTCHFLSFVRNSK